MCNFARQWLQMIKNGDRAREQLQWLTYVTHDRNKKWWQDLETGEPKERNVGEMIALMHSELSEMLEADRKNLMDDKLPHRKGLEVEAADLLIRLFDFCGGLDLDLGSAFVQKMRYNETRLDHTRDARLAGGGKKY